MKLPNETVQPLLKEALSHIPAHCRDVLYHSGCLVWGDKTGGQAEEGILAIFTPDIYDAALLSEAQKRAGSFTAFNNLLLLYTDVQRFGFASCDGFMADGMYCAAPGLAAAMRADYDSITGLPEAYKPQVVEWFVEQMLESFLHRIFTTNEAENAIRLLKLVRECRDSKQPVRPRMGELGITFMPLQAKVVEVPTMA